MTVSNRKKTYMKEYNSRNYVKDRKSEYMRKLRSKQDKEAAKRLVNMLREYGFEDWAVDVAQERAPEMLVSSKVRTRKRR
jgi:hypothetical protein